MGKRFEIWNLSGRGSRYAEAELAAHMCIERVVVVVN